MQVNCRHTMPVMEKISDVETKAYQTPTHISNSQV
jgi:hypothetical protein